MPITAETFELKHFDSLARGITVAREAYDRALNDLHHTRTERAELRTHLEGYERELQEAPSKEQWNRLLEFIADVERGIRSRDELFDYARELSCE